VKKEGCYGMMVSQKVKKV